VGVSVIEVKAEDVPIYSDTPRKHSPAIIGEVRRHAALFYRKRYCGEKA
jgi:hypothetical protein